MKQTNNLLSCYNDASKEFSNFKICFDHNGRFLVNFYFSEIYRKVVLLLRKNMYKEIHPSFKFQIIFYMQNTKLN